MNAAERRARLLASLHRKPTTVPAVARALAVTERTIYRDLAALRSSGHTIDAAPGPGGGICIAPDSRPRPVHFEIAEIVGLALSVAILRATPHMPFASSAEAALERACMALSSDRRLAIERLQSRIFVGKPASKAVQQSLGSVDDTLLSTVERCISESRVMAFDYLDAKSNASTRRIECVALVLHAPLWYVLAWDLAKRAARLFRMDRISAPSIGEALTEHHAPAQLMPERAHSADEWNRKPIG